VHHLGVPGFFHVIASYGYSQRIAQGEDFVQACCSLRLSVPTKAQSRLTHLFASSYEGAFCECAKPRLHCPDQLRVTLLLFCSP